MTDLAEQWVNIYKSKKHGSYWTGAFCYKTKEEAVKDLADKENYLTTVNIEDMLNLQTQNAQLKEQINKCYLDAINRGTANAVKAVKEFGMPERIKELVEQNAQLKELLKECELWFTGVVGNMNDKNVGEHNKSVPIGNFEHIFKEFSQKINEALK